MFFVPVNVGIPFRCHIKSGFIVFQNPFRKCMILSGSLPWLAMRPTQGAFKNTSYGTASLENLQNEACALHSAYS